MAKSIYLQPKIVDYRRESYEEIVENDHFSVPKFEPKRIFPFFATDLKPTVKLLQKSMLDYMKVQSN